MFFSEYLEASIVYVQKILTAFKRDIDYPKNLFKLGIGKLKNRLTYYVTKINHT